MRAITPRSRNAVFYSGLALALAGAAIFAWVGKDYLDLPRPLRLATILPLLAAFVMLRVDQYRDWPSLSVADRIKLLASLALPVLALAAILLW